MKHRPPHALAPFGSPGSIVADRLHRLPAAMQAEGVRLLFEMGQNAAQVSERTGLSPSGLEAILADDRPYRRLDDHTGAEDGR
jgi:hypothetical protein